MYTQENKSTNPNTSNTSFQPDRSGRALGGIIIVVAGLVLLVDKAGADLPNWVTSWPMIPIVAGLFHGARNNFKSWQWLIPVGIGLLFLTGEIIEDYSMDRFFWPIIIITIGLVMIFRPRRSQNSWNSWRKKGREIEAGVLAENLEGDFVEAVTIFGGTKKVIISKNFKGGEAVTVFGGTEVNLTQADVQDRAVLELVQVFGGTKLVVPSNWKIHTEEVVCIFGGIDDKRIPTTLTADTNKTLVLKGMCMFGGIDIKSF